jgi:hypothetical protein
MGPDAFVWLEPGRSAPALLGARLGTRSAFASDVALIAQPDPELVTSPAHFAPDRPSTSIRYDGGLRFDAAPDCAWLTDALFGDFDAQLGFSSELPPTLRVGDAECALPASEGGAIALRRRDAVLSWSSGSCNVGSARVALALCGNGRDVVRATTLGITRRSE